MSDRSEDHRAGRFADGGEERVGTSSRRSLRMWLAGGRSGTSKTWHRGNIPVADELFDDHSKRLEGNR